MAGSAVLALILNGELPAQDFTYTTNNGTITITGYTGPGGAVTIPDAINGLMTSALGDAAFKSSGLTSILISDNVISIGTNTFQYCPGLTNILIGKGVTSIGENAFQDCGMRTISIPAGVTGIGQGAFSACMNLSAVTVDPLNTAYSSPSGVLFDKSQTTLIQYPPTRVGAYVIPDGTSDIADAAFLDCFSLTGITIPDTITRIGNQAFAWCRGLTRLNIPDNVHTIGDSAFYWCDKLADVEIGSGVTNIGVAAFVSCGGLPFLKLPDSVTRIGDGAFQNCYSLTNIIVPRGLNSLGNSLFYFCQSLSSFSIPPGVTNIGDQAFGYTGLDKLTIPRSVTTIGDLAFTDCPLLTQVYFQGDAPEIGTNVFGSPTAPDGVDAVSIFFLPGTSGWGPAFGGRPAFLWNPEMPVGDGLFGMHQNAFGFRITGTAGIPMVVEACTNLAAPSWTSLLSCTLTNGSIDFKDPEGTNYPGRFYRIRSP